MKRRNAQLGYTLLQVLLALEFGTVVAVLGTPKVFEAYANYELRSMANQVAFDIARARMEAIGQNRYVRIQFLSSSQYARQISSDGVNWTTESTRTLGNGITSVASYSQVQFDRRGYAVANNWVWLIGNNHSKYILTNLVGRVTVT
jgi:Tfp pilus assembly protein FimT